MARELRSWGRRIGGLWADGNGLGTPPGLYNKLSLFTFSVFCLNGLVLLYIYVAASYGYLEVGEFSERENIPVEPLTAALFAGSGLTLFLTAAAAGRGWLRRFYILAGLVALFAAGEEVSWGQHIFGFATPDFLVSANYQQETNLHNIDALAPIWGYIYIAIFPLCYGVPIAAFCVRKYRLGPLPLPSLWLAFFFALAANFDNRLSWPGIITLQGHLLLILGIFLGAALFARDKKLLMVVGTIIVLSCAVIFMNNKLGLSWVRWQDAEVEEYLLSLAGFLYCLQLLRDSGGERWLARRRWVKAAGFRTRGRATDIITPPPPRLVCEFPYAGSGLGAPFLVVGLAGRLPAGSRVGQRWRGSAGLAIGGGPEPGVPAADRRPANGAGALLEFLPYPGAIDLSESRQLPSG